MVLTARGHLMSRMVLLRSIGAGLFDSGFASLATFVVGFYAARVFDPSILGAYALAFSAFTLASNLTNQLVLVPCEIRSVSLKRRERLLLLRWTLPMGLPVAFPLALGVSAWLFFTSPNLPPDVSLALTLTAIPCALVSPMQDHVRRMLHLSDVSWAAAVVSIVQFSAIALIAGLAILRDIPPPWIPFGALALANTLSLSTGILLARREWPPASPPMELRVLDAVRSGRWLVITELLASGSNFTSAALVTQLASAAALGYAEAARICAQPIWVLVMGLRAVLGPRSMEAARAREQMRARRISRAFMILVGTVGVAYLLIVGFDAWWNPLAHLLPNAYAVSHLVLVWGVANVVIGFNLPLRNELMGADRLPGIAKAEVGAAASRTAVASSAGVTGAFAMPLGVLLGAIARWFGLGIRTRRYYTEGEERL